MPLSWAAWRALQCVAPAGLRERVRLSKAAICSSAMLRGRPRNSSYRPAARCARKRCRRFADRGLGPAQALCNLGIALALGRPAHHSSAADERMRQRPRSRQILQLCAFAHGQFEGRFWDVQ